MATKKKDALGAHPAVKLAAKTGATPTKPSSGTLPPLVPLPECRGVCRDHRNDFVLWVAFSRKPTEAELMSLQRELMGRNKDAAA